MGAPGRSHTLTVSQLRCATIYTLASCLCNTCAHCRCSAPPLCSQVPTLCPPRRVDR